MKNKDIIEYTVRGEMPDLKQVRENCLTQTQNNKQKSFKPKKILTVVCAVVMLFMLSAFVEIPLISQVGEVIESLIFNGFEVNKVERIITPDGNYAQSMWGFNVTDSKVKNQAIWGHLESIYFETLEKAEKHLAFSPKNLNYMPDSYSFEGIRVGKDNLNRYYKNSCTMRYISDGNEEGLNSFFSMTATYVGKNATMHIDTVGDIEQITLSGDTEALLIADFEVFLIKTNSIAYHYTIAWIMDGVGYSLSGIFDREEMIKMAESVG